MDMVMFVRRVLGVREVVMVRMVMMMRMLVLDRWGKEKLGMNVDVCPALVVVVKRGDLWLSKKAQKRDKDR